MLKKMIGLLCLFLLSYTIGYAAVPAIFYSDLTSGPKIGGQNNKGVFVTISGKNFGSSQGASYVSIGGGQADNYPVWSDTKISFQLGSAAATGNIIVTTSEGASNGVPFTMRAGNIYFVDINSPSDPGSGTFADPWRSPKTFYNNIQAGDTCYIRAGTYTGQYGVNNHFNIGIAKTGGSSNNEVAWISYPGETVKFEALGQTVNGNTMEGNIDLDSGEYYIFSGFQLYSSIRSSVRIATNGNRIINNDCVGNTGFSYSLVNPAGCNNVAIYGNQLHGAAPSDPDQAKMEHPLYIGYGADNVDFGWNHIYDNNISYGNLMQVHQDGGEVFKGIKIHDNIIDATLNPCRGFAVGDTSSDSDITVYNNIFINLGYNSTWYYPININSGNVNFYNNILYHISCASGGSAIQVANYYTKPGIINIKNNIINTTSGTDYMLIADVGTYTLNISNNCYYGNGNGPVQDANAVNADPLFVNAGTGDFHLNTGSPCISQGADVTSVASQDKDGLTRTAGYVDLGAFEYVSPDITAPAAVSNLGIIVLGNSINLTWTAPGDDDSSGTAASYDIRYSTNPITADSWSTATQVTGEPAPTIAGTSQNMVVGNLLSQTLYYLAMKTADEVPNTSGLSNVVAGTTGDTLPPAAINDLSVSNIGSTNVTLAWTAPGDDGSVGTAVSYDIRYSINPITAGNWQTAENAIGEPVPNSAGATDSMVITGLQGNTTYYFAMKTLDDIPNTSGISNTISAKTGDGTAPAPVTDLTAVPGTSDGQVVVSWTAPGDDEASGIAAAYDLRLSQNIINDTNWSAAAQYLSEPAPKVAGSAESITLGGLIPGSTYYFALKTSDEVPNTSALSNVSSARAYKSGEVDITAPAGITTLSAASGAHSGEVVLNWTATGDDGSTGTALTYDVRYSQTLLNDDYTWDNATQCFGEPVPKAAGSAERFVVTGLTPGQQYYFAVQAIDESNLASGVSNVPQAVAYNPIGDIIPPEPITTLQAANTAGGEVTITWTAPGGDGASGTTLYYEIRSATYTVDASNFNQASLLDSVPVPNSAGFVEGAKIYDLDIGQTYYIAVKSADGAGNVSILSNVAVVSIGDDLIAPGVIADLAAVAGTNIGEVVIGWTASGNDGAIGKAKEYDIRYSTEPLVDSGWPLAVKALNTPSPAVSGTYQSATIGSLTANKKYYFGIKSADPGNNVSGLSNIAAAKAKGAAPPGKIADLSGTVGSSDGSVVLSWTAPAAADGDKVQKYEIRYSKDHIYEVNLWRIFSESEVEWNGAGKYPVQPAVVNPGEPQAFAVINLDPGQKYFFAVKSYDSDNNSSVISNVAEAPAANYDATAPAKIADLHAEPGNVDGEVILSWTAPGDNGYDGKAGSYVVKYSVGYIDNSTWDLANALADTPAPNAAGTKEHMFVRNLLAKHLYYFALKAVDPVGNVSDVSNCAETLSGPVMNLERVRSFPNPWKKASGGLITISHLTAKAKVKIFNLAGELVRELEEQDGVAFWDARNESGQEVASGIYLYYAYDDEGREKTGKMAIIK